MDKANVKKGLAEADAKIIQAERRMRNQERRIGKLLGLNLVVLILQDNAYGMMRWKQAVDSFADWGLTFGNPDFVKYAEAYGTNGSRVDSAEALVPVLEAAFAGGGIHLVAVPIDYSENIRVLVDELRSAVPAVIPSQY